MSTTVVISTVSIVLKELCVNITQRHQNNIKLYALVCNKVYQIISMSVYVDTHPFTHSSNQGSIAYIYTVY